jgi:hypothetical protein
MSQYFTTVTPAQLSSACRLAGVKAPAIAGESVELMHGYDHPLHNYFVCSDEWGLDYGGIGLGTPVSRDTYMWFWRGLRELGVLDATEVIVSLSLDLPY